MKKRMLLVLGLVLIAALVMTGCGPSNQGGDKEITIGFVGMTLNNEFHVAVANGAKLKAKELGVNIDVQAGDQHASADAQLQIIENFIENNVDGLIIVPSAPEGLLAALNKAKAKNIPVINLDTAIDAQVVKDSGMKVPFYGTNNYEGAKLAGKYVAEHFEQGTKTAILTGIEGHKNAADRRNGFIDGAGGVVEIVAEQTANWEVDQGYTAAQNIIQAHPDIQLFFCSNDNMGIGALRAVQEAQLEDQVQIIGFDAVSAALDLVESGEFLLTVAQYPGKMGEYGVENLVKQIKGEEIPQEIDTGTELVTKENLAKFREEMAKYLD